MAEITCNNEMMLPSGRILKIIQFKNMRYCECGKCDGKYVKKNKPYCADCGHKFTDELDIRYHNNSHDYEGFRIG